MTREDEYKRILALLKSRGYKAAAAALAREIYDLKQDNRALGEEGVVLIARGRERIIELETQLQHLLRRPRGVQAGERR